MNYISKTEIDLYLNLVTWNLKETFILTNQIVRFNFFKVTHTGNPGPTLIPTGASNTWAAFFCTSSLQDG